MPAVKRADADAVELDAAFAEAMTAPAAPKEPASAPKEIDREAPHGRAEDGTPLAPHGLKADGTPKLTAAGRKSSHVAEKAPDKAPAVRQVAGRQDYTAGLRDTADAAWMGLSFLGQVPLEKLPIVGKRLTGAGTRLQAQALILAGQRDALAGALNMAAQHNETARKWAEKTGSGDATWALVCGTMMLPFLTSSIALWQGNLDTPALAKGNQELLKQRLSVAFEQISEAATEATAQAANAPA